MPGPSAAAASVGRVVTGDPLLAAIATPTPSFGVGGRPALALFVPAATREVEMEMEPRLPPTTVISLGSEPLAPWSRVDRRSSRCETFVHGIDGIERMRRDGIVARVRRLHHHLI